MEAKKNSYLLMTYMLLALSYYFVGTAFRAILFAAIFFLTIYVFILKKQDSIGNLSINKRIIPFLFLFILSFFIQLFNETLTPFVLYLVSAPAMAYFILNNKFETKILKVPIYLASFIFITYFVLKGRLEGIFEQMSVNYISVLLIMNVVLINSIERVQKERISILPAILALLFSLLAMGRAGILCTFLLLLNALVVNWKYFTFKQKTMMGIFILGPIIILLILKADIIFDYISNLSVLERFEERGVDSPSRDILKREYIAHMDLRNILLGFNFDHNEWFIHYGQNPHNSYIRLHHYFGFLFFIFIYFIIKRAVKLFFIDKFLFILLIAILLRSWTDSSMFQTIYDFILIFLILIPNYYTKKYFVIDGK